MAVFTVDAYCDLIRERSRLQEKMYGLGYWLTKNQDHDKYAEREQVWINATIKYEKTCDQIKEMENAYDASDYPEPGDDASQP